MVRELECNGTYPILKLYYFFGISSTILSVLTIIGNVILVWYYRPSYTKRYNTLIFGIGVADIVTAVACLIQVINMWTIGTCEGTHLPFAYTTDQLAIFHNSQYDEQITISTLLYEISITTTVGFTALLIVTWLVDTAVSTATHSCFSTVFIVGYPTLWTVVKMHGLKAEQSEAVKVLWFLLPICIPVLISSGVLFYVKYRVRVFPRRELSRACITKVGLMVNIVYFLLIVMNLIAKQEPQMLQQFYLTLYYTTTRTLPLVCAGKTIIFVCEERSFAKDLEARIKNSFWKPCLCSEGVYLDQG